METLRVLHPPPNTDFRELNWGLSTGFHFSKLNKIAAGTLWTFISIYMHNTEDALTPSAHHCACWCISGERESLSHRLGNGPYPWPLMLSHVPEEGIKMWWTWQNQGLSKKLKLKEGFCWILIFTCILMWFHILWIADIFVCFFFLAFVYLLNKTSSSKYFCRSSEDLQHRAIYLFFQSQASMVLYSSKIPFHLYR